MFNLHGASEVSFIPASRKVEYVTLNISQTVDSAQPNFNLCQNLLKRNLKVSRKRPR
jgi:hypothetical protein